ncbi:MAG: hypothetical protein WB612_07940, partial [Nitrososphaeraceae archaeon]
EYTTLSQSILLRSIVDGDKLDIETFPAIAIATISVIMNLNIILFQVFLNIVLGNYVIIINIIIVGHLSSLSIKDVRGLTHDFRIL